ncbi:MAG: alpha-amylase family glycosyl hydrolase, partial [Chthoniobacterales bacterium]
MVCALTAQASELFLGPVPVQFVAAGARSTLDLHRFYQPSKTSEFQTDGAKGLQVSFDRSSLQLQIAVESTAHGLIELPFQVKDGTQSRHGIITLAVRSPSQHEFIFQSDKARKVAVSGSFNGWSKEATPLVAEGDGVFRGAVALEPGSYKYKFVVDGEWTTDASNPQREPDGLGGTNSLLQVEQGASQGRRLSIYADRVTEDRIVLRTSGAGEMGAVSVVAELADGSTKLVATTKTAAEITVSTAGIAAGTWIRVIAADANGRASNVIRCSLGKATSFRWQDAIIYYALTDRFRDGDKSNNHPVDNPEVKPLANFHGGDWRGIEDKIKDGYFTKLGVNTVWIAPLNRNPSVAYQESPEPHRWYTGYHGYWPVSPTEVEPHFGDAGALKSLIRTAHANGLKVIADLVLHHVHEEHPWWKQHRDWFGQLELPDGSKNLRRWDDYQFTTWFEPYMPSFNFANAAAVTA